jgi:hypothetical protein
MAASTAFLNATLAGTAGGISILPDAGLGNSTPGTTGAGDLTSTVPRQSIAWTAPASAASTNTASIAWAVPASTSGIGWVLLWSATTGGVYMTDVVLGTPVSFSSAGTLTAAAGALSLLLSQSA